MILPIQKESLHPREQDFWDNHNIFSASPRHKVLCNREMPDSLACPVRESSMKLPVRSTDIFPFISEKPLQCFAFTKASAFPLYLGIAGMISFAERRFCFGL